MGGAMPIPAFWNGWLPARRRQRRLKRVAPTCILTVRGRVSSCLMVEAGNKKEKQQRGTVYIFFTNALVV